MKRFFIASQMGTPFGMTSVRGSKNGKEDIAEGWIN